MSEINRDNIDFIKRRLNSIYREIIEIEQSDDGSPSIDSKIMALSTSFQRLRDKVSRTFPNNPNVPLSESLDEVLDNLGSRGLLQNLKSSTHEIADALSIDIIEENPQQTQNGPTHIFSPTVNQNPIINQSPTVNQTSVINQNVYTIENLISEINQLPNLDSGIKDNIILMTREIETESRKPRPVLSKIFSKLATIADMSSDAIPIIWKFIQHSGLLGHFLGIGGQ